MRETEPGIELDGFSELWHLDIQLIKLGGRFLTVDFFSSSYDSKK